MKDLFDSIFQRRLVQELNAQLKQRGELVDQLERQLIELRRNMIDLANERRETDALVHDLENLLEEARAKDVALESDLRSERGAREASEAEMRREISRLLDLLHRAQAAGTELRATIDAMASRGDTVQQAAREALSELERAKGAIQAAHAEAAGERRMRKDKEVEVRTLRDALAAQRTSSAELEGNLAELTHRHGELTDALRAMTEQMQALTGEIRDRDNALALARQEMAHSAARLAELEASLHIEENAGRTLRTSIARAEALLQKERDARAQLEQELRGKIEALIERRDQIKGVAQDASTELERARAALQLAERELAAERELRRNEVAAARSGAKASDQSRMETKALLREAHDALRAEREAARALRAAYEREATERMRLAQDLARNPAQLRIAALEEEIHEHLAHALDVAEPLAAPADAPVRPMMLNSANLPATERAPKRLVVIASADDLLRDAASAALSSLLSAPLLPLPLAETPDLDDWLRQTVAATNEPKIAVLPVNATLLAAVMEQAHAQRATAFAALLLRARVMHLVWSDKSLAIAHRQVIGAARSGDTFDDGDARMSVPLYRDLVRREQRLREIICNSGLFKAADVVKLYAEQADAPALIQFCRDVALAIKPAKVASVGALLDIDQSTSIFARRIRTAVEVQAAETPVDTGVLLALARAQERAGRYGEALSSYEQAVREAPGDFNARLMLSTYLELAGRVEDADVVLREHPDDRALAASALRDLYRRVGDKEKVLASAELMRETGAPQGVVAFALAAAALERTALARRALDEAPDTVRSEAVLRVRGIVERQESVPGLRIAAERGGAEDWFALAETLRQLDKVDGAASAYLRAEGASPGLLARVCGPGVGPDLLLIGPPRTATTLLRRALELSAGVALLDGESAFLTNNEPMPLASFSDQTTAARARKPGALVGDKSPQHFALNQDHIALAALLFPHARIIVTTRDPVERAFSHIKLLGHRRVTDAAIAAALSVGTLPAWLESVLENSRYQKHLLRWAKHFGADRFHLIRSEDLERNIVASCERLFAWLGLEPPEAQTLRRLQRYWSNRTADYHLNPGLEALLRREIGDEPCTPRELEAALKARPLRGSSTPP